MLWLGFLTSQGVVGTHDQFRLGALGEGFEEQLIVCTYTSHHVRNPGQLPPFLGVARDLYA